MEILGSVVENDNYEDPDTGYTWHQGTTYSVIKCPSCKKVNIVTYNWNEDMESEDDHRYEFLYPQNSVEVLGLPDKIKIAFLAAEKVRNIDVNAYAILARRLLELVCIDRNASGNHLASMLQDLAAKGEIPQKLVKVATGLKDFGNIGAHAGVGELTEKEIPIVKALSTAILEYVYSAPYLADIAEEKLNFIKRK